MTAREDDHIREKCFHPSGEFLKFSKKDVETSIPQRFEKIVRMFPDRIAVKSKTHTLTYEDLNQAANRAAHAILAHNAESNRPVAILTEHGAPVITAILGVLKAGRAFLVIDPSFPEDRIRYMVSDSTTNLIVTNSPSLFLAKPYLRNGIELLNVDQISPGIETRNLGFYPSPGSISNLVYTSGSTGQPKGVLNTHRNTLHNALRSTNCVHLSPQDRLTLLRSCSTSGAIIDLFDGLLNGAGIYPFQFNIEGLNSLVKWLIEEKITIFNSVSSTYRNFIKTLSKEQFPDVRLVYLGGETVFRYDLQGYKTHFADDCVLVVRLGSSEAGFVSNYFIDKNTQLHGSVVPVGYPYDDVEILVLKGSGLTPVAQGRSGEIGVKSRYLSPGYWRSPITTQEKFIQDSGAEGERTYLTGDLGQFLPNGALLHLGRKDRTVKIRGFRVELSEIETALLNHQAIAEGVVVAREDQPGNSRLVAYVVPKPQMAIPVRELKTFLKNKLPDYMVPSAFVVLEELPLMPTGKVDRKSLPAPIHNRPNAGVPFVTPRDEIESKIASIWSEVLFIDELGIHDDFFELGGDSLTASQVISRVLKTFQLEIPIQLLFESPTVAKMAAVINAHGGKPLGDKELEQILSDLESLSDEEAVRMIRKDSSLLRKI